MCLSLKEYKVRAEEHLAISGLSRPEPALVGYIPRSERCERPRPDSNATALCQSCLSLKLNVSSPRQPAMGIAVTPLWQHDCHGNSGRASLRSLGHDGRRKSRPRTDTTVPRPGLGPAGGMPAPRVKALTRATSRMRTALLRTICTAPQTPPQRILVAATLRVGCRGPRLP